MSTRTRLMGSSTPSVENPKSHLEWEALLKRALDHAEKTGDRRANGLRAALGTGRAAVILKKFGIVGEGDLEREFGTTES
jgi:hypothetical protein